MKRRGQNKGSSVYETTSVSAKHLLLSLFPIFGHIPFSITYIMALLTLLIVSLQLYGSLGRPPVVQPNTQAVAANQMDDSNTVTPSNQTVLDSSEETEPEEEWVPMITGEHPAWPVHNLTKRAQDLGGQLAPSKQGKYPKGYTSYGGQVWECPGACNHTLSSACIQY